MFEVVQPRKLYPVRVGILFEIVKLIEFLIFPHWFQYCADDNVTFVPEPPLKLK